jgi:uncharacterized protein (DUF1501 family)
MVPGQPGARPGIGRREFLRVGAIGGLLTLADLLWLQAKVPGGAARPARSLIMVVLTGGPSQIDTYDPKPNAPEGIRGEYKPIKSRVPGVQICELFPRQASLMDRLAIVRSVVDVDPGQHDVGQLMTGWLQNTLDRPAIGSVISRLRRGTNRGIPAYVSMQSSRGDGPGFLGLAHGPFRPTPGSTALLQPPSAAGRKKLAERRALLESLERGQVVSGPEGPEVFREQVFDLLTSGKVGKAFDLTQEPDRVRDRYGKAPQLLTALRLVQAGVGCVTVALGANPTNPTVGRWDTHSKNFDVLDELLPQTDQAVAALVEDLHVRGLNREVLLLLWGEMGRTPKINAQAGRDHWPRVMSCVLAGGGLEMGQVVGATDAHGAEAKDRPYRVQNVLATVYHALGIDPTGQLTDRSGRPIHLLDNTEPVRELV